MESSSRVVDKPEIEAKKIFSEVIDYEHKLLKFYYEGGIDIPFRVTHEKYFKEFQKEYVNLILERAKNVERRHNI